MFPHRLWCLNTWFPPVGSDSKSQGIIRRWSFAAGSMSVHRVCAWCLWRPEDDTGTSGTGVTACKLPCGSRELNLCLLEGQLVLLITELSLQPTLCLQTVCLWFSQLHYAFFTMIIKQEVVYKILMIVPAVQQMFNIVIIKFISSKKIEWKLLCQYIIMKRQLQSSQNKKFCKRISLWQLICQGTHRDPIVSASKCKCLN